jgi:hypothetical protein
VSDSALQHVGDNMDVVIAGEQVAVRQAKVARSNGCRTRPGKEPSIDWGITIRAIRPAGVYC